MKIVFNEVRNRQVRVQADGLEVGGYLLRADDSFDFDDPLGAVPVRSVAETLQQFADLTDGEDRFQLGVLVFTAAGNHRALDLYFPITRMLSEPEIEDFYGLVQSLARHPYLDLQLIGERHANLTPQLPSGIRHLVAGHLAEVFFRRRDILERFLTTPRHIQLYASPRAFEQDGGTAGGDYNARRESIQLVLARLFEGFFGETAGVCPFLHEFGHMLDSFDAATGKMGRSEGLLPGLSPRDGSLFTPLARRLFISGKRLELERYLARYRGKARPADPLPVGHPYVFQNDGEFIAGYFEMFFRNPNYFGSQNPDLYAAFVELFGYDPRKAWQQDFPFYINENRNFYLGGERPRAPGLTIPAD